MARLYCPKEAIIGEQIIIHDRKQIHYLCNVLRLKTNEDIFVFNGRGSEYHCQIQELSKNVMRLLIKKEMKTKPCSRFDLVIACALPKQKSRFDDLVDKLVQLGVDKIIPMITERVIVRWDFTQKQRHHQRWCKIARQACAQSERNVLPIIEPISQISQILACSGSYDLKLIPTLMERKQNFRDIITDLEGRDSSGNTSGSRRYSPKKNCIQHKRHRSILILIGPEGDFTPQEIAQAKKARFIPVFLGEQILRVDTAALAVAAFLRLYGHCL